jgi:hypothetical protein
MPDDERYRPGLDLVPVRPADPRSLRDLTSRDGAEANARELDAWWHSRGFLQVRHWAEITGDEGPNAHQRVWGVRSNLINGLPPRDGPR